MLLKLLLSDGFMLGWLLLEVEITHFPCKFFFDVDGPFELMIAILEHFPILIFIMHFIIRFHFFLPKKGANFFSNNHQWLETELQFFAHPLKQIESFGLGLFLEHLCPDLICREEETHADGFSRNFFNFECLGLWWCFHHQLPNNLAVEVFKVGVIEGEIIFICWLTDGVDNGMMLEPDWEQYQENVPTIEVWSIDCTGLVNPLFSQFIR